LADFPSVRRRASILGSDIAVAQAGGPGGQDKAFVNEGFVKFAFFIPFSGGYRFNAPPFPSLTGSSSQRVTFKLGDKGHARHKHFPAWALGIKPGLSYAAYPDMAGGESLQILQGGGYSLSRETVKRPDPNHISGLAFLDQTAELRAFDGSGFGILIEQTLG
jgi:hypothetical protein